VAKILVVDDLAINRKLMTTILKYDGHELFEAANGAEALDVARREQPELMILDVNMPVMGGRELLEQLHTTPELKQMQVVLYTASLADNEMDEFVTWAGIKHVIEKPSEPQDVQRIVRAALADEA
jgi:CheY-like chemotaxis protein